MANLLCVIKICFFKINLLIFIMISISMTLVCEKMPVKIYYYRKWLFRERKWENGGHIYEHLFGVKRWKSFMPDISDFIKWRFNKKHLEQSGSEYLSVFIVESCKSEFTHWMIIMSTLFFHLWNNMTTTVFFFIMALILNLPYIIIQRYNRPRLLRLLRRSNYNQFTQQLSAAKA